MAKGRHKWTKIAESKHFELAGKGASVVNEVCVCSCGCVRVKHYDYARHRISYIMDGNVQGNAPICDNNILD